MGDLRTWYEEDFDLLRDRFEYDLKENEDFQIIRSFVDRSLDMYAARHGGDKHIDTVRAFRDNALASLDRYADGDDDVSFTFSFERDSGWKQPGDVEKDRIEFRALIPNCYGAILCVGTARVSA